MNTLDRRAFIAAATAFSGCAIFVTEVIADGHGKDHIVTIKGSKFSPAKLTIKVGDTVTWENADGARHTATAKNRSFDTGNLKRGDSASVSFNKAGNFRYFCEIHPGMQGVVKVEG